MDADLRAFRARHLACQAFCYYFADATYIKARVTGRVVSRAIMVVTGVSRDGEREFLATVGGEPEDETFWTEVFRSLR